MLSSLSPERITALCRPAAHGIAVQSIEETDSTNADLLAALPTLSGPVVRIARRQRAGRGRAGRIWHTSGEGAIAFSVAWRFRRPLHALVGLPLAVGVALAQALRDFGIDASLKWPNDLLFNGGKLGGILIESATAAGETDPAVWMVIGVGINAPLDPAAQAAVGDRATSVPWLAEVDQAPFYANLLSHLAEALLEFEQAGLAPFVPRWNDLHAYAGRHVRILDNGKVLHEGRAIGIDRGGCLILERGQGQIAVMVGDVSLRLGED